MLGSSSAGFQPHYSSLSYRLSDVFKEAFIYTSALLVFSVIALILMTSLPLPKGQFQAVKLP